MLLDSAKADQLERRIALVARELSHYKIDIAALSETFLPDKGQLTFGDKNDVFLFFKTVKYLTRLTFSQKAHALLEEPQNNRRLTE